MASAVSLRGDYSATERRGLAAATKNANQSRRLLSLAAVLDGMNRTEAARMGGMDRQTLRDWVHRFNDHGPEGLVRPKRSERGPTRSCPNANATKKLLNVRHAGAPASSPGGAGAGRTRRPQP